MNGFEKIVKKKKWGWFCIGYLNISWMPRQIEAKISFLFTFLSKLMLTSLFVNLCVDLYAHHMHRSTYITSTFAHVLRIQLQTTNKKNKKKIYKRKIRKVAVLTESPSCANQKMLYLLRNFTYNLSAIKFTLLEILFFFFFG